MAKFCINCGTKMDETGVCACQTIEKEPVERKSLRDQFAYAEGGHAVSYDKEVDYSQQANKAKEILSTGWNRMFGIIISLLRYPFTKGILFTNSDDAASAAILIGMHAFATALFTTIGFGRINSLIALFDGYLDYNSMNMLKLPLGKIFLVTFLISALLSGIYAASLLLFSILMKNNISFRAALCIAAARSAVIIAIVPVSLLLFLFSPYLGITVFGLGNYAGIAYMTQVFPVTRQDKRNLVPLTVFLATTLFLACSYFVVVKAVPLYLPEALQEIVPYYEQMLDDPSSLLEEILGGYY